MQGAFLPIDICEDIPDRCTTNYETLRACALVCSAWLPRSRYNLLREIRLTNINVDFLLRTLSKKPHLAELVTAIQVTTKQYVPFARFPLPRILRNCRTLVLEWVAWDRSYPPGYCRSIADFQALTDLVLRTTNLSAPEICHIVWSLPLLSSLTLVEEYSSRMLRFGGKVSERLRANRKQDSCRELRRLTLRGHMSSLLRTEHFPPPGGFGHSVTHLTLCVAQDITLSTCFLECVQGFRQLRSLDVTVEEPAFGRAHGHALIHVFQILSHVQSGPALRELRVWTLAKAGSAVTPVYGLTRADFLEVLCGAEMQSALERFTSLEMFLLRLNENDEEHDVRWWTDRIVERLPRLKDVLQVELYLEGIFDRAEFLWDPEGLAQLLRGEGSQPPDTTDPSV